MDVLKPEIRISRICRTVLALAVLYAVWHFIGAGSALRNAFSSVKADLKANKLRRFKQLLCIIGVTAIAGGLICFAMPHFDFPLTGETAVFGMTAGLCFALIVCCRTLTARKPEYLFLASALLVGGLMIQYLPSNVANTWDEGHHFRNALNASYVDEIRYSEADAFTCTRPEMAKLDELLDEMDQNPYLAQYEETTPAMKNLWTAASGFLMLLGRVFHLPYRVILRLGKLGNLLTYAVVGFFAIRKLKSGKMLLFTILMGSTTLFMASSFSYDPWLTAFTALAFSYFFAEWQEPEKPIRPVDAAIMIGSMVVACLPKEIYIPFVLIFLFMPRKKFASDRAYKIYIAAVLGSAAVMVASFALPFLVNMESKSDMRGGSDVNGKKQFMHIVSHPFLYIETLTRFLLDYLKPENMSACFTFFAYKGYIPNFTAYLLTLSFAAATDKQPCDLALSKQWKLRVFGLAVMAIVLVAIPTALYIDFTPVGLEWINGCQPRYLIPLLFPVLMLLGSGKIQNNLSRYWYNGAIMLICSYVAFYGTLTNIIMLGL